MLVYKIDQTPSCISRDRQTSLPKKHGPCQVCNYQLALLQLEPPIYTYTYTINNKGVSTNLTIRWKFSNIYGSVKSNAHMTK